MTRFLLPAVLLLATISAASAATDFDRPVFMPGLWRGHFSGGLNYNPFAFDIALAWDNEVAFFPDDLSCRRWISGLKRQFPTYQGHKGCLRIR